MINREEAKKLVFENIQWFFDYFDDVNISFKDSAKRVYSGDNYMEIVLTVKNVCLDKDALEILSKRDDCSVFQGELEYREVIHYGKKD